MRFSLITEKIDSLIVAIILMASNLTSILFLMFGVESGANSIVLFIIFALIVFKISITRKVTYKVNSKTLVLLGLVIGLFILTKLFVGDRSIVSFPQLLFYSIIPIWMVGSKFNIKRSMEYALIMSILTIRIVNQMFAIHYEANQQADLGRMYSMLIIIIIAIFHFKFYRNKTSKLIWGTYIYAVYVLVRAVMLANRGVFLAILITIFISVLYDFKEDGTMKRIGSKQFFIWSVTIVAFILIGTNMELVVNAVISLCVNMFGAAPSFFIKMQRYIALGDITNNRNDVFGTAISGFLNSPIWGNGIGTFVSGKYTYPHNFILQYLFEGGILFAALPIYLAIRILIVVLTGAEKDKDKYVWQAMLVCQCFPKSLLSGDAWKFTILWFMIAYSLQTKNRTSIAILRKLKMKGKAIND